MDGAFFESHLGLDREQFAQLPRDRAASLVRERIPDLQYFFARDPAFGAERASAQVQKLAAGLEAALFRAFTPGPREHRSLRDRIIVDGLTRSELDRDQNVYLGRFYTRFLTRAEPDVVFQPATHRELEIALEWARAHGAKVCTRGAGTTAMGGAVPNDGGLLLDMSRFDQVQVDAPDGIAVVGAGARFKQIHEKLARHGLALRTYPSNLGGTLAGWFSTGGLGLNSFKHGALQSQVRALSVVLPRGEHVRFHDDGRLDLLGPEAKAQRLTPEQGEGWLQSRRYPLLRLQDLAQTEGQFGVLLTFTVDVAPRPTHTPFFFEFEDPDEAMHFVQWVAETAEPRKCPPANLKYLSREHVEAVRTVRGDSKRPARHAVYVDFDDAHEAARFETGLEAGKWRVHRDDAEAGRWFADRFRPQQTKRLGPGFLAAEILLPTRHVDHFLTRARELAAGVGIELESEVYFLQDGRALALPGYLTRGPRFGFLFEMVLAPMLVDLAIARFDGEPYVLGRWQSTFFRSRFRAGEARRLRRAKRSSDPGWFLNPGVFFRPLFRTPFVTTLFRMSFPTALRTLRWMYERKAFAHLVRTVVTRGSTPSHAALARVPKLVEADQEARQSAATMAGFAQQARGCVNCGECNAVCPIFHDAKIRLPQMLTHLGESAAQAPLDGTELLLDLCVRCGNCEEVCQADIQHLDLYTALEARSRKPAGERLERQAAILAYLRHSERYLRDFLEVRPGGYLQRTPASLPGEVRYLLFRAENEDGAADTCIHCGACVPVCPTDANKEYELDDDLRRITTDLERCIGCGTCVEVCPANHDNGGRTLRVMEAPGREFFEVLQTLGAEGQSE
jgi:FAD/FMN-containing dehydrogenase/ferredoxin